MTGLDLSWTYATLVISVLIAIGSAGILGMIIFQVLEDRIS